MPPQRVQEKRPSAQPTPESRSTALTQPSSASKTPTTPSPIPAAPARPWNFGNIPIHSPNRTAPPTSQPDTLPPAVAGALRTSGQPLDPTTRRLMERRVGHDFSAVRIHTNAQASAAARSLDAAAIASGQHILFGAGAYRPQDPRGQGLLAHELVHVAQHRKHTAAANRRLLSDRNDAAERQADAMANATAPASSWSPAAPSSLLSLAPGTWYRGFAVGVPPAADGGVVHDLGGGVYFTDSSATAKVYASLRSGGVQANERVITGTVDPHSLGAVIDFREDAQFMDLYNYLLTTGPVSGERYRGLVDGRLAQMGKSIEDFAVLIGPEGVRGGTQMCIRVPEDAASVVSAMVPLKSGGNTPSGAPPAASASEEPPPAEASSPVGPKTAATANAAPAPRVAAVTSTAVTNAGRIISERHAPDGLLIDIEVGSAVSRLGLEDSLPRAVEVSLAGWQRAHQVGPGLGAESGEGIRYAPPEVNLSYQNCGIEAFIREFNEERAPGVKLYLRTVATSHWGTRRLATITYQLSAAHGEEKPVPLFETSIEIANTTVNPRITLGKPEIRGDHHEFLAPRQSTPRSRPGSGSSSSVEEEPLESSASEPNQSIAPPQSSARPTQSVQPEPAAAEPQVSIAPQQSVAEAEPNQSIAPTEAEAPAEQQSTAPPAPKSAPASAPESLPEETPEALPHPPVTAPRGAAPAPIEGPPEASEITAPPKLSGPSPGSLSAPHAESEIIEEIPPGSIPRGGLSTAPGGAPGGEFDTGAMATEVGVQAIIAIADIFIQQWKLKYFAKEVEESNEQQIRLAIEAGEARFQALVKDHAYYIHRSQAEGKTVSLAVSLLITYQATDIGTVIISNGVTIQDVQISVSGSPEPVLKKHEPSMVGDMVRGMLGSSLVDYEAKLPLKAPKQPDPQPALIGPPAPAEQSTPASEPPSNAKQSAAPKSKPTPSTAATNAAGPAYTRDELFSRTQNAIAVAQDLRISSATDAERTASRQELQKLILSVEYYQQHGVRNAENDLTLRDMNYKLSQELNADTDARARGAY